MHILHLIKTSQGATWAIRLMQELKVQYPEVTFSVAIPLGGKHTNEHFECCRNVYELDYSLNKSFFRNGKKLKEIVIKDQPDIIHSWFTQTTLYARLFLRDFKIPRLFQVVGPAHLENNLFRWADIKSSNKDDYWIATSQYILDKYKKNGVSKQKLFLNYAFVDAYKLLGEKEKIEPIDVRKELNIPQHNKIIGTASYIYPPKIYEKTGIKGHEYLLDSFKEILSQRDDVVLIIAGETFGGNVKYENKLKQLAKEMAPNKIFFTGGYKHVLEVLPNFDVFVYLSKSENLGGVYESLLFEVPTVCSNRGALPELVENGVTGYNVELQDIQEIADKILLSIDKSSRKMKLNGKERVLSFFNKESIPKEAFTIYNKVCFKNIQ